MNNNGIEDILISRDYNTKKKKPKGFFVMFFILVLILVGLVGAYMYFTRDFISSKELFVQNLSKINTNKLLKNEVYTNLIDRLQKESSQIESSINFTTDIENEELKDIDITKFKLDISNLNDVENKKNYNEAVLNYSGNEVFKLNLASAENEIALASDEILNQYVGIHLDKIKEVFGININIDEINEIKDAENINLSETEIDEYTKKYLEVILNNISEDKFGVQENIAIENATEDVEVTNYSVTLTQEELKTVLIEVLKELKNDEKLLGRLTTETNSENTTQVETPIITPSEVQNNNSNDGQVVEENTTSEEPINSETPGETQESQEEITNPEENLEPEIPVIKINPVGTVSIEAEDVSEENQTDETANSETVENTSSEDVNAEEISVQNATSEDETVENKEANNQNNDNIETIETTDIDELIRKENDSNVQLTKILLGKKVDLTQEELKLLIDELIKEVEAMAGNGIKINIYASEENVEKINVVLSNNNIIDIDFFPDNNSELNSNQSYIKITYLEEDENSERNGFALEINKEQSSASIKINAEYSFIENEKINKKIKLDLKTEGTTNSKELKNDIVITMSTNKTETQVAIDNTIQFKEVSDLPGLNSENCIYLDLLPEADRQSLLDTIKTQVITLYTNKKENLNFIDTNTYSQTTLENQSSSQTSKVTREEAKNALITKVSNMMQEAIDRNEEFTIQNLVDLKIDGYKVSAAVTAESALIVVDVYKFNIDTGFTLTDVE